MMSYPDAPLFSFVDFGDSAVSEANVATRVKLCSENVVAPFLKEPNPHFPQDPYVKKLFSEHSYIYPPSHLARPRARTSNKAKAHQPSSVHLNHNLTSMMHPTRNPRTYKMCPS